jgi:hypothetical protein
MSQFLIDAGWEDRRTEQVLANKLASNESKARKAERQYCPISNPKDILEIMLVLPVSNKTSLIGNRDKLCRRRSRRGCL